jgi:hypothetical protein
MNDFDKPEAASDAQLPAIYDSVDSRTHPDDAILLNPQIELTTGRAVRANRRGDAIRHAFPSGSLIEQCAGWTYVHTGTTKLASQGHVRLVKRRAHSSCCSPKSKRQHAIMAQFLARAYAATAQDAEVVITVKEWVLILDLKTAISDRIRNLLEPNLFDENLELALSVFGAGFAAGRDSGLAHCPLPFAAACVTPADEAAIRMLGKN